MRNSLLQLYKEYHNAFKDIKNKFPETQLSGPHLMSLGEQYTKQTVPLLVVGQETHGWQSNVDSIEEQLDAYERFNVGEAENRASPFWNVTRKIEKILGNEPYSCAWTNVSKFDVEMGRAHDEYKSAISQLDEILYREIILLKPKMCLFFTGPDFDGRLSKIFDGLIFTPITGFESRMLCRLQHTVLPLATYRTYHPKYLRIKGLENRFLEFITSIAFE